MTWRAPARESRGPATFGGRTNSGRAFLRPLRIFLLPFPILPAMRKTAFEPCIPTPGNLVPAGPDWLHEIKHDGYRLIVQRDGPRVRLFAVIAPDRVRTGSRSRTRRPRQ